MPDSRKKRFLRPETLTAIGTIIAAAALLFPTAELRPISALLPAAMLAGLIVLSVLLLIGDQRQAARGEAPETIAKSWRRVVGAFCLILAYVLGCDFLGFYPSTIVVIPLVAWIFGFRNPLGLFAATVIVVGAIWLIFDFGMSQEFPAGRLWQN